MNKPKMYKIIILLLLTKYCIAQKTNTVDNFAISCGDDEDCRELSQSAKCVDDFCYCDKNCNFNAYNSIVTRIGETCISSKDCLIQNSYCLEKRCTCKLGFVESATGKNCLNVSSGINDDCIEDSQCSASVSKSVCSNNTCICPSGRKIHLKSCINIRELGEICDTSYECSASYSKCNQTCQCIKGYIPFGTECLTIPKTFLSRCRENIQCEYAFGNGSAVCKDGTCMCRDLYHIMKSTNKCSLDFLLGEKCGSNSECHQPGAGESKLECILGECKCKSHFIEVEGFCISGGLPLAARTLPILIILLQALLCLRH